VYVCPELPLSHYSLGFSELENLGNTNVMAKLTHKADVA
jgi:hypothetical protein